MCLPPLSTKVRVLDSCCFLYYTIRVQVGACVCCCRKRKPPAAEKEERGKGGRGGREIVLTVSNKKQARGRGFKHNEKKKKGVSVCELHHIMTESFGNFT